MANFFILSMNGFVCSWLPPAGFYPVFLAGFKTADYTFMLIVIISIIFNIYGRGVNYEILNITPPALLYINPIGRLFEFVLGMCLGHAYSRYKEKFVGNIYLFSLCEITILTLIACNLFYTFFLVSILKPIIGVGAAWFGYNGSCVFFDIAIFTFAFNKGIISKLLCHKVFLFLGELSFCNNMVHQLVLRNFDKIKQVTLTTSISGWSEYCLFLLTVLIISIMLFFLFETPCRKLIIKSSHLIGKSKWTSSYQEQQRQTKSENRLSLYMFSGF